MGTEAGVMQLQAKGGTSRVDSSHERLRRGKEDSSPESAEGAWPGHHLDIDLLASRTMRE